MTNAVSESEIKDCKEGVATTSQSEAPRESWRVRETRRLWWRIHSRFPNAIPGPYAQDRSYVRNRDRQQNSDTQVPAQEEVRLRAIWGAELFGPSEVDQLYLGLQKLAWDDDRMGQPGSGALYWIREQRMYGSEGSFNLGVVHRREDKKFLPRDYFAPLPKETDYLIVKIFQLSASLTCVLVGFVLKEEHAKCYETELNTDRKTINEPIKRKSGYLMLGVENLKRRAIDDARTKYRNVAVRWFETNLPGFFCLAGDGNRLPTAELITTNSDLLLTSERDAGAPHSHWPRLLVTSNHFDMWTNAECSGLRLSVDELSGDTRFHTIVSLRTADLTDEHLKYVGGRTASAFVAFCQDRLGGILSNYAALALLREAGRTLKLSRETLKSSSGRHRQVLRTLDSIKRFFDKSLGTPTIASELLKKSERPHSYSWDCADFRQSPQKADSEPTKIAETLRARTEYLATRVLSEEVTTREHFQQIAAIMSTRESVKAQRRMEVLTVVAITLAGASLLVALPSLGRWSDALLSFLKTNGL